MEQFFEFAGNHLFLVGSFLLLVVLVIVNELRLRGGGVEVDPADAVRLINDGAQVFDVRSAEKYAQGHIVGARSVPLGELDGQLETLSRFRDKPVLVCCDMGPTGGKAVAALRKASFERVFNLRGGLAAWQRENFPLTSEGKKGRKG
jgi:rhodanese-related sulfurtransferase